MRTRNFWRNLEVVHVIIASREARVSLHKIPSQCFLQINNLYVRNELSILCPLSSKFGTRGFVFFLAVLESCVWWLLILGVCLRAAEAITAGRADLRRGAFCF